MIFSENRFPLFRIMHGRTRGPSLPGWGELTGSNVLPRPRKPGLELRPGAESPDGKSRCGTPIGERAPFPTLPRKRGRGKRQGRAPHREMRRLAEHVCRRSASFFLLSLRFVGWVERSETHRSAWWITLRSQLTHPTFSQDPGAECVAGMRFFICPASREARNVTSLGSSPTPKCCGPRGHRPDFDWARK